MDPCFWRALSLLGDSRLLLPASAALMVAGHFGGRKPYRRWSWALAAVGAAVLTSKLAYLGLGIGLNSPRFTGFSGHAAFSSAVWPILLTSAARMRSKMILMVAGLTIAAVVAASRPPLHAHSWTEVITGWLLGAIAAVWSLRGIAPGDVPRPYWTAFALGAGLTSLAALWNLQPHKLLLLITGHQPP